jgi:hypothetical protein
VNTALSAAGFGPSWLRRKDRSARRMPPDLMRAAAMDEVLPLITAATLRSLVRKKAG